MAHDAFISHSSKDKMVADATCAWLEKHGVRCWVAYRDIRPGASWGSSIIQAIRSSRVMILIFSNHANASPQITREVERAVNFGVTIIPMRIEDVLPEGDMEYFLGVPHWLDAFRSPLEHHLAGLVNAVNDILIIPVSATKAALTEQEIPEPFLEAREAPPEPLPEAREVPPEQLPEPAQNSERTKKSHAPPVAGIPFLRATVSALEGYFGIEKLTEEEKIRRAQIAQEAAMEKEKEREARRAAEAQQKAEREAQRAAEAQQKAEREAQRAAEREAQRAVEAQQEAEREAQRAAWAQQEAEREAQRVAEAQQKAELEAQAQAAAELALRLRLEAERIAAEEAAEQAAAEQKARDEAAAQQAEAEAAAIAARAANQPKAGQEWTNSLGMKFVPAGTDGVLFCTWHVRVQDWRDFVQATGHQQPGGMFVMKVLSNPKGGMTLNWALDPKASWEKPGFDQGPTHPVVGVSWNDAEAFCQWLTEKEQSEGALDSGQAYRLPTDAEWSTAVGDGKYPWGEAWPPPEGAGNYGDEAFVASLTGEGWQHIPGNDGFAHTSPVGSFRPNAYGLYDMGGNVWEWCEDQSSMFGDEPSKASPSPAHDGGDMTHRVLRGAAWNIKHQVDLRSECRVYATPGNRKDSCGFRCVVVVAAS